jgi:hypothetical protein
VPALCGAQAPAQDSVSGSGIAGDWGRFEIDVRSGPSGENPTGQASFESLFGLVSGSASCLAVRDNIATFNLTGTFNITAGPFSLMTFVVTDNAGLGALDVVQGGPTARSGGVTNRSPGDCSPLDGGVVRAVSSGDIVVVDAPPLPTSKDQCKNGGWRNYGDTFKNQGQCVAFVQRGPNP